jgi:phage shock protein E
MTFDPTLAVVAAGVGLFLIWRKVGGKVSTDVVKQKLEAGATVVDVRSQEEFRDGSYPGALNIPVQSLATKMGTLDKKRPVIVFCASGARSAVAARLLKSAGFADVLNAGGLSDMPR